ncbi:hypothetical protein Daus18300_014506 [Diaporthe australafricana]|uniref:Heterokaryon incompatibility domain-containing protein n=1 Tax=Diaporthe australafricana TaxID=127596 RepID=A0ABR3VUY0_9PEZI
MPSWAAETRRSELVAVSKHCPGCPYLELEIPPEVRTLTQVIIITISHDQGFSDTQAILGGTYEGSSSYFELTVISPSYHERVPTQQFQHNVNASLRPKRHENVWSLDSLETRDWLASIRGGDTIQLLPRAEFPAWMNYVHYAEIKAAGELATDPLPALVESGTAFGQLYQPLKRDRREIRVVKILSEGFDDIMKVALETISLDNIDRAKYEALSYCWGDATDTRPLAVQTPHAGELIVTVTSTLYDALRRLRPVSGPSRTLWADALCINQLDVEERSHQVSLMKSIYTLAEQVNIWLGRSTEDSRWCFDRIKAVAAAYGQSGDSEAGINTTHDSMAIGGDDMLPFVERWRRCNFPYFRRTWVLQEVANAKSAWAQCGDDIVPWPVIVRLADCIMRAKRGTDLFRYSLMPSVFSRLFPLVGGETAQVTRSSDLKILDVLVAAHDLDATDPRDKIFAMLQFGSETTDTEHLPSAMRPDYSKSVIGVYVDFTRWWIAEHQNLDILSAVHTLKDRGWQKMSSGPDVDLTKICHPTWCFWYGGAASRARSTLALGGSSTFSASGSSAPDLRLLADTSSGSSVLRLAGFRICTIESIGAYTAVDKHGIRRGPSAMRDIFIKIFDAPGLSMQWLWEREDHRPKERSVEVQLGAYFDHLAQHVPRGEREANFPCLSGCFFKARDSHGSASQGLCPHYARVGDIVVILYGGSIPYLLRKVKQQGISGDNHEFVGECYLEGFMDGHAMSRRQEASKEKEEVFSLV